jgi:DNA-binding NtrC family response regulator
MSTSGYHTTYPSSDSFRKPQSGLGEAAPLSDTKGFEMVGSGTAMQRLRLQVRRIGPHFRTVLVSGEPGSGKELAARALHDMSPGAAGPFVICHAATLEDVRGEGGEGADCIAGLIKMAHRGTLFFDGVGEMPLEAQARLLRVLRRHEWAQEGLAAPQKMDLRIVASSSQDLRALVAAGRFRQELYQRIATLEISLPPLRERMEDIPELAVCFLRRFARLYGKSVDRIAEDTMERLKLHRWSGNVRELEDVLRNGVLLCEGSAFALHELPAFAAEADAYSNVSGMARLQDVVEQHVLSVLKGCAGNKLRAAEVLGISRSTLYRMLETCLQGDTSR